MKTYVLTISRNFQKSHKRAGEPTNFFEKIEKCEKIHTIRGNYDLWAKRAKEINEGRAVLSVRYWDGKPYKSKQVEVFQLIKIGVDKFYFHSLDVMFVFDEKTKTYLNVLEVAKNDGLSFEDFKEWFKNVKPEPMAIIHFTDFRY